MKVISIHSVFGGVGKTLVSLCSAVQSSWRGLKTALVEIPCDSVVLADRLRPLLPTTYRPFGANDFSRAQVLLSNIKLRGFTKALSGLHLGLACPDPNETNIFSGRFAMRQDGPCGFDQAMENILSEFEAHGFDLVFIDNPSGICFLPGVQISSLFKYAWTYPHINCEIWFGSRSHSLDVAKTLYEIAIYDNSADVAVVNPLVFINGHEPTISKNDLVPACLKSLLWREKANGLIEILNKTRITNLGWKNNAQMDDIALEIGRMLNQKGVYGDIFDKLVKSL